MTTNTRTWTRVLALVLAVVLLAAACGGDDGGDGDAGDDTTSGDDAAGDDAAGDDDAGGDDAGGDDAGGDDMAVGEPVYGGTLTYLVEAESDTWDVPNANCAVSCITVMRQVADPLMIINDESGRPEPFLLESLESSDDFTEYTLVMREGVTFHDGTPADGAAVQRNLVESAKGLLLGQTFVDLLERPSADNPNGSIELVDPMTVKVTFDKPYAIFPWLIAERSGWLLAPSFWDAEDRSSAFPISTGPFEMVDWVIGEQTVLEKNENYWRTDSEGRQLPFLDGITFRPNPASPDRRAIMEADDADANHDSNGENREFWETTWIEDGGNLLVPPDDRETTYLMFNNAKAPFDNADLRRAVALCTNREEYIELRAPGNVIADGPFAEGALGFLDETGFPDFDPEAGNALLDEIGRPDVINYGTTNDPANLLTADLFAQQWSENCGLNVQIDQFLQSELITKALGGEFEVFLWRNHGQGNPAVESIWWHSRHATGLRLNFGAFTDPNIDALLEQAWGTVDEAELDSIAQQINQLFGENVYNLWLNYNWFGVVSQENVHGVGVVSIPTGGNAQPLLAGRTWLHEAWKDA